MSEMIKLLEETEADTVTKRGANMIGNIRKAKVAVQEELDGLEAMQEKVLKATTVEEVQEVENKYSRPLEDIVGVFNTRGF